MAGSNDAVDDLQLLVSKAKEFEKKGKLKDAKHAFLDAASVSLKKAKTSNFVDKISYENITRALILQAKDIQLEINLLKESPLPLPPTAKPSISIIKRRKKDPDEGLRFVGKTGKKIIKVKKPRVRQLITIHKGGIPILSYNFEDISHKTSDKLNEILFSGAITAVSQLMKEVLDQPIQTITFEEGILLIHAIDNLYYVLFADEDTEVLTDLLNQFCKEFHESMDPLISECIRTGMTLSGNQEAIEMIIRYFKN